MNPRVLIALVALVAAALALPAAAHGQTPRTAWGDPDLQGTWTNTTTTPLERPDDLGDKEVLTDEEWAARNAVSGLSDDRPFDTVGFYNDYWLEQGQLHERTSLIVDPPDGKLPAYTAAEEQRIAARRQYRAENPPGNPAVWTDLNVYDRCLTRAMPGAMMPGFYNHNYHILQTPDHVVLVVEMIHDARVIPLDGRPSVSPRIRQWLGDSRGRWEGDTLVIETTNFNAKILRRGGTVLGGDERLRVVERLRRVDADTIDYQVTVTDPTVWTDPWTASIPMNRRTEGTLFEYACHEGNYGLRNMLTGARAAEETSR